MSRNNQATLLRTPQTWESYCQWRKGQDKDKCFFCSALGGDIGGWNIIPNDYPYDAVTERHDLLFPSSHTSSMEELGHVAQEKLDEMIAKLNKEGEYDAVIQNFANAQTVPGHFHVHLVRWKRV